MLSLIFKNTTLLGVNAGRNERKTRYFLPPWGGKSMLEAEDGDGCRMQRAK